MKSLCFADYQAAVDNHAAIAHLINYLWYDTICMTCERKITIKISHFIVHHLNSWLFAFAIVETMLIFTRIFHWFKYLDWSWNEMKISKSKNYNHEYDFMSHFNQNEMKYIYFCTLWNFCDWFWDIYGLSSKTKSFLDLLHEWHLLSACNKNHNYNCHFWRWTLFHQRQCITVFLL